ncbi:cytochrome-c oxidase, cbb3-type subunit III [Acidimangrovimonas sediminis]|uniref:cytochrome-c oxidase, cbb3-type subunit III n=1 Tax=Acidimangrovimonas sediminis TaxID=2056283 RepID=UPI000C80ED60|nr:cytochrome-c oxidase, cbb3-type subunit III [Acidimangrovimonas sediminis]
MSDNLHTNRKPGDPETTGHSWDGIEEFNNPMPRWWVYVFYLCIAFALIYSVLYPAWPLVNRATPGILGWSTRGDVKAEMTAWHDQNKAIQAKLVATPLAEIKADPALAQFATNAGGAVFRTWCAQCHGSGAAGNKGFPNLLDDDWLWGGTLQDIHFTVTHGVRNADDGDARYSQMPAFGKDGILDQTQIRDVVQYVMSLSNAATDPKAAEAGKTVFAENCAACHGENAKGDRTQGAPNLTDAIWLYGGDRKTLTETVTNARFGVMPAWGKRLSDADIQAVTYYVHSLGGGE